MLHHDASCTVAHFDWILRSVAVIVVSFETAVSVGKHTPTIIKTGEGSNKR